MADFFSNLWCPHWAGNLFSVWSYLLFFVPAFLITGILVKGGKFVAWLTKVIPYDGKVFNLILRILIGLIVIALLYVIHIALATFGLEMRGSSWMFIALLLSVVFRLFIKKDNLRWFVIVLTFLSLLYVNNFICMDQSTVDKFAEVSTNLSNAVPKADFVVERFVDMDTDDYLKQIKKVGSKEEVEDYLDKVRGLLSFVDNEDVKRKARKKIREIEDKIDEMDWDADEEYEPNNIEVEVEDDEDEPESDNNKPKWRKVK